MMVKDCGSCGKEITFSKINGKWKPMNLDGTIHFCQKDIYTKPKPCTCCGKETVWKIHRTKNGNFTKRQFEIIDTGMNINYVKHHCENRYLRMSKLHDKAVKTGNKISDLALEAMEEK